jgi:hypothetical protein
MWKIVLGAAIVLSLLVGFPQIASLFHVGTGSTIDMEVVVSPMAKFEVINVDSGRLYRGAENVLLTIVSKNIGTTTADNVTARFIKLNSMSSVSPTEPATRNMEYPKSISPGYSFTTTFVIDLPYNSTIGGVNKANLQLDWVQGETSGTTQRRTFSEDIPVLYHVAENPESISYFKGIPLRYLYIAVIIEILLIGFVILRHRRVKLKEGSLHNESTHKLKKQDPRDNM